MTKREIIATINAPFPDNKTEELQEVISLINSYGVDLLEFAREQPLDPDFRQISQEAQTGLNFKKVDIIVDVSNGPT